MPTPITRTRRANWRTSAWPGFTADREGIAIYARDGKTGYIVCTDQLDRSSQFHVYRREGAPGNPHDHTELLKVFSGSSDATDGIEITAEPLPGFPQRPAWWR